MTLDLALHLAGRKRKRDPLFGALSRAAAAALSARSLRPLAEAVSERRASVDDVLFMAQIHGVSGLLDALASEDGADGLPEEHRDALRRERAATGARAERIAEEVRRLGERASRLGLPFIPLKGTFLATERYRDASLRPTADIDLLTPGTSFPGWSRLLAEEGYSLAAESFKNQVFDRPGARAPAGYGEHADNPRPVELHERLRERFVGRVVDFTDLYLEDAREGTLLGGLPALVPGPRGLAAHLFAHAAPAAVGRGLRLVQLADLSHLAAEDGAADAVAALLGEAAWGLASLFERELPGALPRALAEALTRNAPGPMRRRAWLARPGLMTGDQEGAILLLAELRLCRTKREALQRVLDALPEPSVLRNLYGARTRAERAVALVRYYWDRFF